MSDCAPAERGLMKPREAAVYLAVSPRTLHSLKTSSQVKFVRVGSRGVRYRKADLDAYAERQASKTRR